MHPVLFEIGRFQLGTWGISLAVSFVVGIAVAVKRAPRFNVTPNVVMELAVVIIIAAYTGSRLWYAISHIDQFKGNWLHIINPFQHGRIGFAGLSMIGGVVLGILASLIYSLKNDLNFVTLGNVIAPSFLLGVGIHRLGGCFLAGCCFGRPTGSVLGVVFPPEGHLAPFSLGTPLWPTQLFASVLGFAGFGLVYWLERRDSFSRRTFWLVFTYYSIARFIVDQFRYYEPSQILGTLGPVTININHIFLGGIFIMCIVFWVRLKKF